MDHVDISPQSCCAGLDDVSAAVPHGGVYQLAFGLSLSHLPFPSFVIMSFGQPTQIDDKVADEKVALAPTVQPPSYQITSTTSDVEPAIHYRRRRLRRLFHFSFAALFIWVAARHVLRHCERRRFGPPHLDSFHWVSLRWNKSRQAPD